MAAAGGTASSPSPIRIAIVGGGVGGLTAAYELSGPEHRGRYEITVYQLGFRLGGKGAAGHNLDAANRIEEHGLHVWMGFYENAFRMLRACYAELKDRREDATRPPPPPEVSRRAGPPAVGVRTLDRCVLCRLPHRGGLRCRTWRVGCLDRLVSADGRAARRSTGSAPQPVHAAQLPVAHAPASAHPDAQHAPVGGRFLGGQAFAGGRSARQGRRRAGQAEPPAAGGIDDEPPARRCAHYGGGSDAGTAHPGDGAQGASVAAGQGIPPARVRRRARIERSAAAGGCREDRSAAAAQDRGHRSGHDHRGRHRPGRPADAAGGPGCDQRLRCT
ncbi:MAG: NAD(P)-binding protein [Betaproteobacteria bacterium]|nr:NAD(P)-binding protein [Betaproteobacteria bacterium]